MTLARVTQNMMMNRSYTALQSGLARLSRTQEQLTTGRVLNRPSDSPTDTTSAMRIRGSIADQKQYTRNAQDGLGWLGQTENTVSSMLGQVRRARELALTGANAINHSAQAREALAVEVDQLRASLIGDANATYLGRPVFGGLVNGSAAYDPTGAFVGVSGDVRRTVAKDLKVSVNVNGPDLLGPDGANLFDDLAKLAGALRSGDGAGIRAGIGGLEAVEGRMTATLADLGTRYNQVERASHAAGDFGLQLTGALSEIENVDITRATIDLRMNEVAYQAALASTARLVQPSLADFLR